MKRDLFNAGPAFLSTLGAMPIACSAEPDDEVADATTQTPNPSTDDPGTSDSSSGTTDTEDASTTEATADADDGSADDDGTTGDVPEACQGYAQHYAECFPGSDRSTAAQYCATYLGYGEYYGAACIGAIEDVFACLATIDCAAWQSERAPICEAEYAAVTAACPWEEDTTGGSGGSGSSDGGDTDDGDGSSSSG